MDCMFKIVHRVYQWTCENIEIDDDLLLENSDLDNDNEPEEFFNRIDAVVAIRLILLHFIILMSHCGWFYTPIFIGVKIKIFFCIL